MAPLVTLATRSWPSVRRCRGRERPPGGPRRNRSRCPLFFSLLPPQCGAVHGRLPEWPKGTVCKTVGSAYVGSNPTPATTCGDGPLAGNSRLGGPFLLCPSVCHLVAL